MDRVYLEWNIVNWITVVLMVAVFYAVIGLGVSALRGYLPAMGGSSNQAQGVS